MSEGNNAEELPESVSPQANVFAEEYVRYVSHLAADIADQKASRRENVYLAVFVVILAGLTLVGYSSISSMREDVATIVQAAVQVDIETRVEKEIVRRQSEMIQEALDARQGEVEAEIAFVQFATLADELIEKETGLSFPERDAAVSLVGRASKSAKVTERPEFIMSVENLVDVFFKADLEKEMDDLDDALGDLMLKSQGIVITMINEYGIRVAGEAEVSKSLEERFEKYARAAKSFGQDAMILPYRIAMTYRKAGLKRNDITDEYFVDATHIKDADEKRTFIGLLEGLSAPPQDENAKIMRAAMVFEKLSEDYAAEIKAIKEQLP